MITPNFAELIALRKFTLIEELRKGPRAIAIRAGRQASLFKGRGLDFSEVREYSPEDDARAIDWRVTARTGRAHSKVFREERERSVYIFIDVTSRMRFGTRRTFKSVQAARAAALVAWMANRAHDRVGAIVFGQIEGGVKILRPKASRVPIHELFKLLCAKPDTALPDIPVAVALEAGATLIPSGASVFVISDFADCGHAFEKALARLGEKRDLVLLQMTDPADQNIAAIGEVRFTDGRGNVAKIDTRDPRGARNYAELWRQRRKKLEDQALRARARLVQISTEGDVTNALAKELRGRP